MAKIQPAVKTISVLLPGTSSAGTNQYFGDISQMACVVNRRFYRQGLNWVVAGFKVHATAGWIGDVGICRLPDTWICSNAWHKAYAHWKAQQDDAVREAGGESAVAKFRDFKVHMDPLHVTAGFGDNLVPRDCNGNEFLPGEWQASQIVLPNIVPDASGSEVDPQEYFLHMLGDNNHGGVSRGVIDGYASSRAFPQSPDPVGPNLASNENWYMQMENVGNESPEVIANATDRNDDLPYDQEHYPGGDTNAPGYQLVDINGMSNFSITNSMSLKGDTFPCGLFTVEINTISDVSSSVQLEIYLVPGPVRGYLTQPMQDM